MVCCEYFTEGMKQIDTMIIFSAGQSAGLKYTYPKFVFCPYCGRKIEQSIVLDEVIDKGEV